MNTEVRRFINYVESQKQISNKDTLIQLCQVEFHLTQDRTVFHNRFFAVRLR